MDDKFILPHYSTQRFSSIWKRNSINPFSLRMALAAFLGFGLAHAQVVTDSWSVGGGFSYPRYVSTNIEARNLNYGGYLSQQRNMSEHVSLRLREGFTHMEGDWNGEREKTNMLALDLGLMYYLVPCEPISPYLVAGGGGNLKRLSNRQSPSIDHYDGGMQLHLGIGSEYRLDPQLSVVTEFSYFITDNSDLDGTVLPNEIDGRDAYLQMSVGINFQFGKGPPSAFCDHCVVSSLKCQTCNSSPTIIQNDSVDYARIEGLILKNTPKEVRVESKKEIPVDRYIQGVTKDHLVLVGVNFDFDQAELLPESYPVLDKSVEILNARPEVKIEIQGYTDYIGSLEYNRNLSLERAERVKKYFVEHGIIESRISTFGFGKRNPSEDNQTVDGREMNRRITIRIAK